MQKQDNTQPKVRPIQELPEFAQECMSRIWAKHGVPKNKKDIVVTFHDSIYTAMPMAQDLFIHESVHFIRQGGGADLEKAKQWCMRYVDEPEFRKAEEILAYREQYQFILRKSNRNIAFEIAKKLATDLSSPIYGNIISFHSALSAIIS